MIQALKLFIAAAILICLTAMQKSHRAIVLVSFQVFNPEVWAAVSLAKERGQVSTNVWNQHTAQTYKFNHAMKLSRHFNLLDQIQPQQLQIPVFSLATPARSEADSFPKSLLSEAEIESGMGLRAFRNAESKYKDLILENYASTLISYPKELLAANGLCTAKKYQLSANDFTHLNNPGANIWCQSTVDKLNYTLNKNKAC